MSDVKQLIERFNRARAEMRAAILKVDPVREISPGWDVQAVITHIIGWEEVTHNALRAYLDGDKEYLLPAKGIDAHNDDMVRARAAMPFEEVLHEWETTRESLKSAMAELSERDLYTSINFPWGMWGTIGDMLAVIAEHEAEHARELETT